MSADIPDNVKQLFAGDAPMTDAEVEQFMNWLMLNHGDRVIVPDYDGETSYEWERIEGDVYDVVEFIFTKHINKIKPAFTAIIKKNGPHIYNYWWNCIVKAGILAIDFVAEIGVSFEHFELGLDVMTSYLPELVRLMSKNAVYNLDGERIYVCHRGDYAIKDIIKNLTTSHSNTVDPLKAAIVSQSIRIAALEAEIAELRLRPPELGGPDYEAAKSHFDGEKSSW